jgi:hypothetical protein
MARHRRKDPLIWGVILIVVGAIFMLENYGIDVWDYTWKLWPIILIIWGALKLFNGLKEKSERKDTTAAPQGKP